MQLEALRNPSHQKDFVGPSGDAIAVVFADTQIEMDCCDFEV